ncbi:PDZ domain-containing protein [Streptomyces atriruber]|uniref:PDZ domain-containing protein n=1 Tax=Streptomyces atriruber TaxID=545121 RepID=A0ABV3BQ18_9ACTN
MLGPGRSHRPHAVRRRGRRLTTLLFGILLAAGLVLSGIGIGTVSATVIGMSKLAEIQKAAPGPAGPATAPGPGPGPVPVPKPPDSKPGAPLEPGVPLKPEPQPHPPAAHPRPAATLGIEAVDAPQGAGALLVGVHVPGPGHAAGLVRGDTLLAVGGTRIDSAAELAAVVGAARPGRGLTLTVRHEGGGRQVLSGRPGVVT